MAEWSRPKSLSFPWRRFPFICCPRLESDDLLIVFFVVVVIMPVAFDMHLDWARGDAVGDDDEVVFAKRQIVRHVEMGVMDGGPGGDTHGRVIERAAVRSPTEGRPRKRTSG